MGLHNLVQRLRDAVNSRSSIMRNQEWDAAPAQLDPLDFAQLVLRFFRRDAVHGKATLDVVD
jgi:hypothetical protein